MPPNPNEHQPVTISSPPVPASEPENLQGEVSAETTTLTPQEIQQQEIDRVIFGYIKEKQAEGKALIDQGKTLEIQMGNLQFCGQLLDLANQKQTGDFVQPNTQIPAPFDTSGKADNGKAIYLKKDGDNWRSATPPIENDNPEESVIAIHSVTGAHVDEKGDVYFVVKDEKDEIQHVPYKILIYANLKADGLIPSDFIPSSVQALISQDETNMYTERPADDVTPNLLETASAERGYLSAKVVHEYVSQFIQEKETVDIPDKTAHKEMMMFEAKNSQIEAFNIKRAQLLNALEGKQHLSAADVADLLSLTDTEQLTQEFNNIQAQQNKIVQLIQTGLFGDNDQAKQKYKELEEQKQVLADFVETLKDPNTLLEALGGPDCEAVRVDPHAVGEIQNAFSEGNLSEATASIIAQEKVAEMTEEQKNKFKEKFGIEASELAKAGGGIALLLMLVITLSALQGTRGQ